MTAFNIILMKPQLNDHFTELLKCHEINVYGSNFKKPKLYISPVEEFLQWVQAKGVNSIDEYATERFTEYCQYLINRPNKRRKGTLSQSTIRNHLFALRIFFEDLLMREVIAKAVVFPRFTFTKSKEREVLTKEEIRLLYAACDTKLERSLLNVGYGLGLRRTEMEMLRVRDINHSSSVVVVRKGKGSKRREVPMSDFIASELRDFVRTERHENTKRGKADSPLFFISSQGKPVSGNTLNRMFKSLIDRTNYAPLISKDPSLHNLRHSIGNHLLANGATIEFVRDFLGHAEIDTAALYAVRRNRKRILPI